MYATAWIGMMLHPIGSMCLRYAALSYSCLWDCPHRSLLPYQETFPNDTSGIHRMVRLVLWQCMHLSWVQDIEPGDFVVIDQSGVNAA